MYLETESSEICDFKRACFYFRRNALYLAIKSTYGRPFNSSLRRKFIVTCTLIYVSFNSDNKTLNIVERLIHARFINFYFFEMGFTVLYKLKCLCI